MRRCSRNTSRSGCVRKKGSGRVEDQQALWLTTTEPFCQRMRQQRGGPFRETSDPARGLRRLVERDALMTRHVEQGASARGLAWYAVDGGRSLAQMITLVEEWFVPYLAAR